MSQEIHKKTIQNVEKVLKKEKDISITNLYSKLKSVDYYSLNKIIKKLNQENKVIIARFQTFDKDNKVITHSVDLRWVGDKDGK